jgi:hypothetical protein
MAVIIMVDVSLLPDRPRIDWLTKDNWAFFGAIKRACRSATTPWSNSSLKLFFGKGTASGSLGNRAFLCGQPATSSKRHKRKNPAKSIFPPFHLQPRWLCGV